MGRWVFDCHCGGQMRISGTWYTCVCCGDQWRRLRSPDSAVVQWTHLGGRTPQEQATVSRLALLMEED